jgi:hypothetical protein
VRVFVDPPLRQRDAHPGQRVDGAFTRLLPADGEVRAVGLGDLLADAEDRVERGHRLLEDHRDVAAADGLHLRLGQVGQVLPLEQDLAVDAGVALGQQAQHAQASDGLAAAAFAHHAQAFAGLRC